MGKKRKIKKRLKYVERSFEEFLDYYHDLQNIHDDTVNENRYLYDFIRYKNLLDEFSYFKANAHEVDDPEFGAEFPFKILTL